MEILISTGSIATSLVVIAVKLLKEMECILETSQLVCLLLAHSLITAAALKCFGLMETSVRAAALTCVH